MLVTPPSSQSRQENPVSEQDTSGAHGSATPPSKNSSQKTLEASNKLRFILLFISIIISLLVAPFFLTDNIFKICIFFATFTTLIFALTDLIIYLSKESPSLITPQIDPAKKGHKTNKNPLIISTKKVVHYIQRRQTGASRIISSILKNKWLAEALIIAITFPASLIVAERWKDIIGEIATVFEFFAIKNKSLGISILATIIVALIIFHKRIIEAFQKLISSLTSKYFVFTLASLAIIGASSALIIPSYTNWFREATGYTNAQQNITKENTEKTQETPASTSSSTGNKGSESEQKSTSDLRLHLLYITGGIIAILGLIETNRKNSQDHIRQVHAARRDRYIVAVDKLSNSNASVRLGGVYALVGLVDEWLDDDNMDRETRIKEGQIIINNLCSYIRSPFPLAEKIEEYEARKELEDLQKTESEKLSEEESSRLRALLNRFKDSEEYEKPKNTTTGYAKFHEEQDVRRAIFVEMSKRSSTFIKKESGYIYDLGKILKVISGTWSDFDFDFSRAPIFYPLNDLTIEKGNFSSAKFHAKAEFSRVTFTCNADFSGTNFIHDANFIDATFIDNADFSGAVFTGEAKFIGATPFINVKDFSRVIFTGDADFNNAEFLCKANFMGADFAHEANFNETTFTGGVSFHNVIFTGEAKFGGATFTNNADFVEATFKGGVGFHKATFTDCEPIFTAMCWHARFSAAMNPHDYNFSVTTRSKPINLGTATLLGKPFMIPLSTILFDPDSNDISEPAKQMEDSGRERRKPFK